MRRTTGRTTATRANRRARGPQRARTREGHASTPPRPAAVPAIRPLPRAWRGTVRNPATPNEAGAVAGRPRGAAGPADWITTHGGHPDYVFTTNAGLGQEPDKEWITIDTNRILPDGSPNPNFDRIYMMYVNFNGNGSKPYVQTAIAHRDGTHTDWTAPVQLPTLNSTSNNTYLFPHVDPNGAVYTSLINFDAESGGCCVDVVMDYSSDGGVTWNGPFAAASDGRV